MRELVEAFKNLIVSLNLVIKSDLDFDNYFETLCNLIQLQSNVDQDNWEIDEVEKQRIFELSSHVIEIIRILLWRRIHVPQIVHQPQGGLANQYGRSSTRL